jgi:rare lipoprotein A (peptidoglycan hydrolase)
MIRTHAKRFESNRWSRTGLIPLLALVFTIEGCSPALATIGSMPPPTIAPATGTAVTVIAPPAPSTAPKEVFARMASVHIGNASWYGPGFSGKTTANGAVFDETKMTAAHKTLPLGTKAKVTNLKDGKSVQVEINDRGPYIDGRIIDLSQAAAKALGMLDRGIVKVRVETLENSVGSGDAQ